MLSLILFLYFSVVFYEFLVLCFCKKEKCLLKTNQRTDKTSYNLNFISILGLSRSASIRNQTMEKTHSLFINLPLYSNASSSCMCTNHTNERMCVCFQDKIDLSHSLFICFVAFHLRFCGSCVLIMDFFLTLFIFTFSV